MGIDAGRLNVPQNLRTVTAGIGGRLLYWEYAERVRKSMKWDFPSISQRRGQWRGKALLICGGGPSLKADLPKIRDLQRQGGHVMTVNKTHDYFLGLDEPIIPWGHTMLDPMPWVADYVKKARTHVKYFVASSCDPAVVRRLKYNYGEIYLWHAGANFYGTVQPIPILEQEFPDKPWGMVVGPTTVGLRSIILGYELGFRVFHLFGMDSSMARFGEEYRLHAYPKDRPPDSEEGSVILNTKAGKWEFYTNNHMGRQAIDFENLIEEIGKHVVTRAWEPVDIRVYGDGLLPCYAASIGLHGDEKMNIEFGSRKAA